MAGTHRNTYFRLLLFVFVGIALAAGACAGMEVEALRSRAGRQGGEVSRRVMTFYYPWYGTADGPGGAGRTMHWGRIDAAGKEIAASTNYPALGAYDSHDSKLIDQHCRWARHAGIDTFIVSWWGHDSYSDRAMEKILDRCRRHGLKACIYYEAVPRPRTPQAAADDIVKVLNKYSSHAAYLKVGGRGVVFVYGRALGQLGLTGWFEAIRLINERYDPGVAAIGDKFSFGCARVFDGVHTYNTAGSLRGAKPVELRKWAGGTYRSWVQLADEAGRTSTLTVIPGYDDTKIRKPGLAVKRYGGELYRVQWEEAIKADPHWILITSFNEWHEGSEIEPSAEYGDKYLEITGDFAGRFKAKKRSLRRVVDSGGISADEKARLKSKLSGVKIGVLADADSMAFWWLVDLGADIEILSWEDVAGGKLTADSFGIVLYCAGEGYRRTVRKTGDVDEALSRYLAKGGTLAVLPSMPWPFYYDEDGKVVRSGDRFGLTFGRGWERPASDAELTFVQPGRILRHLPERFAFPRTGDLRWRPFVPREKDGGYISLLKLRDGSGGDLGDGIAYSESGNGRRVLYVWFGLLEGPYAQGLLYDVFDFLAGRVKK